jgi:hypothetical protein
LRRPLDATGEATFDGFFAGSFATAATGGEDRRTRSAYTQCRPDLDELSTRKTLLCQNTLLDSFRRSFTMRRYTKYRQSWLCRPSGAAYA